MATMTETAPPARLKMRYLEEIRPQLIDRFGYSSVMQAPRLEKITLNMGVGEAKQDSKALKAAVDQLATIAGQQPSVRRARKSIAAFKLREGMPVGVAVTLRGERSYEFLDRLVSIAIPRIRDFRGLNPRSFDGRGNYSMGVKEQIIFPEVDYDAIDQVRGLDITITTTAATDAEAFALLYAFGMPFAAQGRPKGFNEAAGVGDTDGASGGQDEEPESAVQEQAAEPEAASGGPQAAAEPEAADEEPQAAAEPEPEPEPEAVGEAPEPEAASEEPEASAEPVGADAEEAQQPEQQANAEKESSD
jgi:large subunit ribosomal protein L5